MSPSYTVSNQNSVYYWGKAYSTSKFSPENLDGLVTWLRADKGVTLNSGNVSQWEDQSDYGNDALQASPSNQPLLVSGALNGYPVIRFNLAGATFLNVPTSVAFRTVFMVMKANVSVFLMNEGILGGVLLNYDVGGVLLYGLGVGIHMNPGFTTGEFTQVRRNGISVIQAGNRYGDFSPLNSYFVATFVYNFNRDQSYQIGRMDNGVVPSEYFDGDIAEIIDYNRDLTGGEIEQVENYLMTKYNIT